VGALLLGFYRTFRVLIFVDAQTGIMGYTKSGDPLVSCLFAKLGSVFSSFLMYIIPWKVGPVIPPRQPAGDANPYEGQYIAAGYTGHGMPRAYAWLVSKPIYLSKRGFDMNVQR